MSDRVEELLAKAAAADQEAEHLREHPLLGWSTQLGAQVIEGEATRQAITTAQMRAAGYRAEALVLQLQARDLAALFPGTDPVGPVRAHVAPYERSDDPVA